MPLLLCPNDNTAMQEIDRHGVMIDVCPECRGVWLDRGELEKMLDLASRARSGARPSEFSPRDQEPGRQEPPRDDRPSYDRDGYDRRKKKKRFDLFDFFD